MNQHYTLPLLILATLISQTTLAQNESILEQTNHDKLEELADQWRREREARMPDAIRIATSRGLESRQVSENGEISELQGLDNNGNLIYYITGNLDAARTVSTDKVWPGGSLGFSLSGDSMTVGEWDGGAVRSTHQELSGRVTQVDAASSIDDHPTHVAGTLIGQGVDSLAKGMAYTANLHAYDWSNDNSEMATAAGNGMLISNHSYGEITGWRHNSSASRWEWWGDTTLSSTKDYRFGFYTNAAAAWDQIARNAPYYLIVKSAGNDRGDGHSGAHYLAWHGEWSSTTRPDDGGSSGYDCISSYSGAKNILTIGAVNAIPGGYSGTSSVQMSSFSGWGPTDDGRIKPDLVANGVGVYSSLGSSNTAYASWNGTSMATPSAAGSLVLIQQHYKNETGNYLKASTLKALAIHTADEAGSNLGPDYEYGWGLLNTSKAVEHISDTSGSKDILEASLGSNQTYTFSFNANGLSPIRATICWTDVAGTPVNASIDPTTTMLVNDLDIRIIRNSDSTVFQPYILNPFSPSSGAIAGDNFRDNVEQIYMTSPTSGSYTVVVTHKSTLVGGTSQDFSLILDGGNIPSQPLGCQVVVDSFPNEEDFDNYFNCSTTAGASCIIPAGSGFVNDTLDDIDWTIKSSGTPTTFTGPTGDYTDAGSGKYIYTEASSSGTGFPNKQAILNSPCYNLDTLIDPELAFAYHMYGAAMGEIKVEIFAGHGWTEIWSESGDQGQNWLLATVDLTQYAGDTVKFRFIGTTGTNYTSDMALDGIEVREKDLCPDPFALLMNDVTTTSATFSWTSQASTWRIRVHLADSIELLNTFIPWNPVQITGLTSETYYDVYIQDSCADGDTSVWIGPLRFRTNCIPYPGDSISDARLITSLPYWDSSSTEFCHTNKYQWSLSNDVFYKLPILPCVTHIEVSLCNSFFDTFVHLLDENQNLITRRDDYCGLQSYLDSVDVTNYDTVYIVVEGYGNNNGSYILEVNGYTGSASSTFYYSNATYCTNHTDPVPTITGTSGGVFTSQPGISLNNATGEVNLSASVAGNYWIYYDVGCNSIDSFNMVISMGPTAVTSDTTICEGANFTLLPSGAVSYNFYSTATSTTPLTGGTQTSGYTPPTDSISSTRSYFISALSGSNCEGPRVEMVITVLNSPNVSLSVVGDTVFCQGDSAIISTSTTGTYQWYQSGVPLGGMTSNTIVAYNSGTYNVLVTGSNGCSDSSLVGQFINASPLPNVSISPSGTANVCQGNSVTLIATTGSMYAWYRNGNPISGANQSSFTTSQTGNYNVMITNGFSCSDSASNATTVVINSLPNVSITPFGSQTICQGDSVVFTASSGSSYTWYRNGNQISSSNSQQYAATMSGIYNVVVTNAANCSDSANAGNSLNVNPYPNVSLSSTGSTTFCEGDSVLISVVTSGVLYQWFRNGIPISPSSTISGMYVNQSGLYNVVVTNTHSCEDSATVGIAVTVNPIPNVIIQASRTEFCDGETATLAGPVGFSYQWYKNGSLITGQLNRSLIVSSPGNYNLELTDGNQCSDTSFNPVTIQVYDLPMVTLNTFPVLCDIGSPLPLNQGSPANGQYIGTGITGSTGSYSFDPQIAGAGMYTITYKYADANNCVDSASNPITVEVCSGIEDIANEELLKVFPNPTSGFLNIEYNGKMKDRMEVRLYSSIGQLINSGYDMDRPENNRIVLDMSSLAKGTYFLQLTIGQKVWNHKITKQ